MLESNLTYIERDSAIQSDNELNTAIDIFTNQFPAGAIGTSAVAYVRHNNASDIEPDVQVQLSYLRQYAISHGIEILAEMIDAGYTGMTLKRPGLTALRELVSQGTVQEVLVVDMSRLSCHLHDLSTLRIEFAQSGATIRAIKEAGCNGLMEAIVLRLYEYDREQFLERMKQGKARKRAERQLGQ